jgi:hypothetical protein
MKNTEVGFFAIFVEIFAILIPKMCIHCRVKFDVATGIHVHIFRHVLSRRDFQFFLRPRLLPHAV